MLPAVRSGSSGQLRFRGEEDLDLNGCHTLVTGAGSGLGAATAKYFASAGSHVSVLDISGPQAEEVASVCGGTAIVADVADAQSVSEALAGAVSDRGAPRVVVNCAGIAAGARIVGREGTLSLDVFERTLRVNLIGTYTVMSCAARAMMALDPSGPSQERGVIVNTASVAAQDGQLGQAAYAASKGAVASMCLPAAREFARFGIRVVTISPGLFETPMMDGLPDAVASVIAESVPFPKRLGAPKEFARLARDIAENPYLNGTNIRLDGAVRLPPG